MTLTLGDLETQYRLYLTKSLCLEFPTPFNLWVICSLWIFVCVSVAQWIAVKSCILRFWVRILVGAILNFFFSFVHRPM